MRNPLRSEAEAFRFLGVTIVGAALIVAGAYVNTWVGVVVAVLVVGGMVWWIRGGSPGPAQPRLTSSSPAGTHRLLLVAASGTPLDGLAEHLDGATTQVVVLVPALASRLEAVTGAVDDRRAEAQRTADTLASGLAGERRTTHATVGADDPLQAIDDALRTFGADEIAVVGQDDGFIAEARQRFALPISRLG